MSKYSVQFTVYVQLLLWLFFGLEYSLRWVAPESERVCQWVCVEIDVENLSTYQIDLYIFPVQFPILQAALRHSRELFTRQQPVEYDLSCVTLGVT